MKNFFSIFWLIFLLTSNCVFSQKSINYQTIQGVETGYVNDVVTFADGYFVLMSIINGPSSRPELIITRFDNCHDIVWTKKYRSNTHVSLETAIVDEGQLIILAGTGAWSPIVITLNLEGEILSCNRFNHDNFTNPYNLHKKNGVLYFFGPSNGAAEFRVDQNGDLLSASILSTSLSSQEIKGFRAFGSGALSNGTSIRRIGNVLACVSFNGEVIWAHHYLLEWYGVSEKTIVEVEDGFVLLMETIDGVSLVKLDYDGMIQWTSPILNIRFTTASIMYDGEHITIVAPTLKAPIRVSYTQIVEHTGEVDKSVFFEFDEFNGVNFPEHSINDQGDLIISGSILIDFGEGEWEDMLIINPQLSICQIDSSLNATVIQEIQFEDVTASFEVNQIDVEEEEHSLQVKDIDDVFFKKCISETITKIDTSLDCNNQYVFQNEFSGANYLWSDGRIDSVRVFQDPTMISVVVENCLVHNIVEITIKPTECDCQLFVPNIININSTNIENRVFSPISNCELSQFDLTIFDRWGNIVFNTNDINLSWTGKINGNNVMEGVYVYSANYAFSNKNRIEQAIGTVTVLK